MARNWIFIWECNGMPLPFHHRAVHGKERRERAQRQEMNKNISVKETECWKAEPQRQPAPTDFPRFRSLNIFKYLWPRRSYFVFLFILSSGFICLHLPVCISAVPNCNIYSLKGQDFFCPWIFCFTVHTYSSRAGGGTPVHASASTALWDLVLCLQAVSSGKQLPGLYPLVFVEYSIQAESPNIKSLRGYVIQDWAYNLDQKSKYTLHQYYFAFTREQID